MRRKAHIPAKLPLIRAVQAKSGMYRCMIAQQSAGSQIRQDGERAKDSGSAEAGYAAPRCGHGSGEAPDPDATDVTAAG